jgi:hypothetical protein
VKIRAATLNLWGRRGDCPDRRTVLRDGLRELEPDLVAFVEAIPDDEYERELQALATARFLEELVDGRELHVVLAGDFTADPDSAGVRFLSERQSLDGTSVCYRDAWESANPGEPGETFTPRNPLVADLKIPTRPRSR